MLLDLLHALIQLFFQCLQFLDDAVEPLEYRLELHQELALCSGGHLRAEVDCTGLGRQVFDEGFNTFATF